MVVVMKKKEIIKMIFKKLIKKIFTNIEKLRGLVIKTEYYQTSFQQLKRMFEKFIFYSHTFI